MIAMEGQSPAVFILRIKVADRKITKAETHVIRSHPDGTRSVKCTDSVRR